MTILEKYVDNKGEVRYKIDISDKSLDMIQANLKASLDFLGFERPPGVSMLNRLKHALYEIELKDKS